MPKKKNDKRLFESKTLWGVVVMLTAAFLGAELTEATRAAITQDLVTAAGAALAIYGRLKADRRISGI